MCVEGARIVCEASVSSALGNNCPKANNLEMPFKKNHKWEIGFSSGTGIAIGMRETSLLNVHPV